jgi:hypothetical protein
MEAARNLLKSEISTSKLTLISPSKLPANSTDELEILLAPLLDKISSPSSNANSHIVFKYGGDNNNNAKDNNNNNTNNNNNNIVSNNSINNNNNYYNSIKNGFNTNNGLGLTISPIKSNTLPVHKNINLINNNNNNNKDYRMSKSSLKTASFELPLLGNKLSSKENKKTNLLQQKNNNNNEEENDEILTPLIKFSTSFDEYDSNRWVSTNSLIKGSKLKSPEKVS